jgi:hypothetical protein
MPVVTAIGRLSTAAVLVLAAMAPARSEAPAASPLVDELKKASAAYAEAFNKRDYAALADQWTARAELVEGGTRLHGRDTIVDSIKMWRERHPEASLAIQLRDIEPVAEPIARVSGVMRFTKQPGAAPIESRFSALRVKEGATWRLAESRVTPAHVAALDDLDWMLGTWQADVPDRATIQITYEKALGGYAIVGRTKITPKPGKAALLPDGIEALEVIHADRDAGLIRAWVFDSTGARADGYFEFDGTSFEKVMSGTPSEAIHGRRATWVQVIAPGGDGKVTTHMIERTIDGVGLPDARPLTFKKVP